MDDIDFAISTEVRDDFQVVSVRGELDVATASEFRTAIDTALEAPHPGLILDLTDVSFLDSTALGVLIGTLQRVGALDKRFGIVISHPSVTKVMRVTGIDRLMPVYATLTDALHGVETPLS